MILCSFPSSVVRLTTRAVSAKRPGQIVYLSGHSGNHTSRITRSEIKSSSEPSETSNARPARQIKDHKGVTSKSQTKKKKKRLRHSGRLLGRPNPSKCSRRPKQMSHGSHNYFLSGLATNSIFVRLFYLKKSLLSLSLLLLALNSPRSLKGFASWHVAALQGPSTLFRKFPLELPSWVLQDRSQDTVKNNWRKPLSKHTTNWSLIVVKIR